LVSSASLPNHQKQFATEIAMKKISLVGLLLGAMLGMAVALIFGKWLFWLGAGLAIGLFLGSAQSRRSLQEHSHAVQRRASF
jgi:uncharacterized membrane protein YoaK (UPF0700 family)